MHAGARPLQDWWRKIRRLGFYSIRRHFLLWPVEFVETSLWPFSVYVYLLASQSAAEYGEFLSQNIGTKVHFGLSFATTILPSVGETRVQSDRRNPFRFDSVVSWSHQKSVRIKGVMGLSWNTAPGRPFYCPPWRTLSDKLQDGAKQDSGRGPVARGRRTTSKQNVRFLQSLRKPYFATAIRTAV